jgi:hypothetical protein
VPSFLSESASMSEPVMSALVSSRSVFLFQWS